MILDVHNNERKSHNLTDVGWDVNLEQSAKILSDNLANRGCILEHNLSSFGQNLYAGYGFIDGTIPDATQAWIDEKFLQNDSEKGHYFIIINDSIQKVGCWLSINYSDVCFVVTCNYN